MERTLKEGENFKSRLSFLDEETTGYSLCELAHFAEHKEYCNGCLTVNCPYYRNVKACLDVLCGPIEIAWDKVPVDTPIIYKETENSSVKRAYFALYCDKEIFVWSNGSTSWSANFNGMNKITDSFHIDLAREEDKKKFYK